MPLWNKSNYSFLEGASHPDEYIAQCASLHLPTVALTDRDGIYGMVRAHVAATNHQIKLLVGSEITIEDASTAVLISRTKQGYANMCKLLSAGRLRNKKGVCNVSWEELCSFAPGNTVLLASIRESVSHKVFGQITDAFPRCSYLILARHLEEKDPQRERVLKKISKRFSLPLVASTEVLYHRQERSRLQDVLTCIKHKVRLFDAGTYLKPNAEHSLLSAAAFAHRYRDIPDAVQHTVEIAASCSFSLKEIVYRYPSEYLPEGYTTSRWLRELTTNGAKKRYGTHVPDSVKRQLLKELTLIDELDYCGYFLTMWDIVQFCEREGIICQGRGSAANSVVCYCLGITAVDPVQMDLLFERFLSKERAEPPDIDLDIEHRRREEVIQHMYDKYGRSHAAMVANVVRYRTRSAIREVGKVLGISETTLDMLSKLTSYRGGEVITTAKESDVGISAHKLQIMDGLVKEIQDFPRHLSIHPGGFLLGSEPIHHLVPVENATMPGRTVIQWDKYDVEELGLFKVDLLGLGALTHLHFAFDLLKENLATQVSMRTIPVDDSQVYDMICEADTVGVFQIESRAQMGMLPRLRPRCYYDIVIEVSIVRPGPIAGGMVHPFLRRRNGEEQVTYPHPSLEPVLKKTLGVPLFQEQVMRLAVVAAGYTPGEADQLRRDMAAWKRQGSIERHREKLIDGMLKNDIAREFAEQVFEQIRGFGEYGFPESHAASFAHIAYCTAWLKCHYPVVFACGLLNAWPMGFYSPATVLEDGKRHGVLFLPVDILKSNWDCRLEHIKEGTDLHTPDSFFGIRMGIRYVRGVGEQDFEKIEASRMDCPQDLATFLRKANLASDVLENLAQSGALSSFGETRREVLWGVLNKNKPGKQSGSELFTPTEPVPLFEQLDSPDAIYWDHAFSSHSTHGHPLEPYRRAIADIGLPDASTFNNLQDGESASYAGLIICRQLPETAGGTLFITLEDETGFVNCIVWKKVFQEYRTVIISNDFLGVSGTVQAQSGVTYLVLNKVWKPNLSIQRAAHTSRDFH